jgi:Patatin-like phospholipase
VEVYSPERRTALILTGTGADGAYHAGVLRALYETGIKLDLVCGRGVGAVGAVFAAVDGAGRLSDAKGLWRRDGVGQLYTWRWPVRLVFALVAAIIGILLSPILFLAVGLCAYVVGLFLGMAGLDLGAAVVQQYSALLAAAFAPSALPTWLPRLIALCVIASLVILATGALTASRTAALRRHPRQASVWSLVGSPLDGARATRHFVSGLWDLLRGGASISVPATEDLSRRFSELLNDNLGQPRFSELLLMVHDLDARRDLVFGLVRDPFRRALFPPSGLGIPAPASVGVRRRAEAFDLAGLARDHLVDVLRAALTVPGVTDPVLVRWAADGYWRGETHRLVDRPGCLGRLLEEAAAAGAEQAILVSAAADPPGPHELARPRLDPLGRLSEHAGSMESVALRDAVEHVQHRFRALYQIRPTHNPVGAFDLRGAYDERSDRNQSLTESIERGYEDAYRQFIEPVVGTSGEHLRTHSVS